jgi:hypothetical protein
MGTDAMRAAIRENAPHEVRRVTWMTVAPPVLLSADCMEVLRSYQPAARSSGRAIVLSALPELRSVTRIGVALRVSEGVFPAFKAATLAYGPVRTAVRVMGC